MKIAVNGELLEMPEACSIAELLEQMQLAGKRVAVEVNLEIVPRSQHATQKLQSGDRVEVVHAIGGG